MAKKLRNKARKLLSGNEVVECWYDQEPTQYCLDDRRDNSEIWCCPKCIKNKGQVKRFKPKITQSLTFKKSLKISSILPIKKSESGPISEGLEVCRWV